MKTNSFVSEEKIRESVEKEALNKSLKHHGRYVECPTCWPGWIKEAGPASQNKQSGT